MSSNSSMPSVSTAAALGNPEILYLILKKVQGFGDILAATEVSRLWRRTAHRAYSALELCEMRDGSELDVMSCIRHFQLISLHIVIYWVSEDTPFFLGGLAVAFPKLRDLVLFMSSTSIGPNSLKGLLKAFPLLESFTYRADSWIPDPEVLSAMSHIKVLKVELGGNLPESFYDLTSLQALSITDERSELRISPSITRLTNLTKLKATIDTLDALPPGFRMMLTSLKVLKFVMIHRDGRIGSVPDLRSLSRLRLFELRSLLLYDADSLTWESLHLPPSLVSLTLIGLPLSTLPEGWEDLASLELLELKNCTKLKQIPASVGMLRSLKTLIIHECPWLRQLPAEIGGLKKLQQVSLTSNMRLRSVPRRLRRLSSLKWMEVEDCPKMGRLPWQLEKLIEDSKDVRMSYLARELDVEESYGQKGTSPLLADM